jgi:hypothetical protein
LSSLLRVRPQNSGPDFAWKPANVFVQQYDEKGIRLILNGNGRVSIAVRSGDFAVKPNSRYTVSVGSSTRSLTCSDKGTLVFPADLQGETHVDVRRAHGTNSHGGNAGCKV